MKKLLLSCFAIMLSVCCAAAPWFAAKFPAKLVNAKGKTVATASALNGKMVAVYFSASWCGPCRGFTPELVKFYNSVSKKSNLELVFVSSDQDASSMRKYMKDYKMPWLAIPFGNSKIKELKRELGVTGIPTLAVYDKNGKLVTKTARGDVATLGNKAVDKWKSSKNVLSGKILKSGNKTRNKNKFK